MSVLRPRPPTDPIDHLPPAGVLSADGRADPDWQAWLDRAEAVRGGVASSSTTAAEGLLAAYGTTRSQARRRDSALFGILDVARRVRESVDRVVVIGDRADRALVDLLLGTCCHPCHDDLPRHERGGRPRIWTLGPDDDDDTVQGILDALGTSTGDRLLDAWGVMPVGPCREAFTQDCVRLFAAAHDAPGHVSLPVPGALDGDPVVPSPPVAAAGGDFPGAIVLPAAVAGIDVVRLLEGGTAMARRFREAPAGTNPVVSLAIVGRWLTRRATSTDVPRRRLIAPGRWSGLRVWHDHRLERREAGPRRIETGFTTAIDVAELRRAPFAAIPRASTPPHEMQDCAVDRIVLPRCDEHTIGQLLEALRLAAAVESRLD